MVRILISFSLMLSVLVVCSARHGKHQDTRQRQMYPGKNVNGKNRGSVVPAVTPAVPPAAGTREDDQITTETSVQLDNIENMFKQINQNLVSHQMGSCAGGIAFFGCGCGNCCCGNCSSTTTVPTITQPERQEPAAEIIQGLKKYITDMRREIGDCCKSITGQLSSETKRKISALLNPVNSNNESILGIADNIVKDVQKLIEGERDRMKKQIKEWNTIAAEIVADHDHIKFKLDLDYDEVAEKYKCTGALRPSERFLLQDAQDYWN